MILRPKKSAGREETFKTECEVYEGPHVSAKFKYRAPGFKNKI